MMIILALVIIAGVPRSLVNTIGIGRVMGIPVIFLIAAAFALVASIVLHRTRFGLHTFAIGSNPQAAERAGIKVRRHLVMVYAISGLCAGLAGYITLSRFASTTIAGHSMDNLRGPDGGKVVMVGSSPGISTVDQRVQGFEEEIATFTTIEFIGMQYAGNEISQAQNMFSSLLSANPDLVGVASPSENPAMGVAGAIRNTGVGDTVSAAGVDASEAQIELLREGILDALVIQQPYEMGYQAVEAAVKVAHGDKVVAAVRSGETKWRPMR